MATYYVSNLTGNNSNPGNSWDSALATIAKAMQVSGPNDTIYVQGSSTVYHERLGIPAGKDGQKWLARPGTTPIIDGKYTPSSPPNIRNLPKNTYVVQATDDDRYPSIMGVSANGVTIDGFRVQNVAARGIEVTGDNVTLRNMRFDWIYLTVILFYQCKDGLCENCEVTRGSVADYATEDVKAWGRGTDIIVGSNTGIRIVFRNLKVHHNRAEGIVLGKRSEDCVIEHCMSWNNYHMNIYVNNSTRSIVRYNAAFSTKHPDYLRNGMGSEPFVISSEAENAEEAGWARGYKIYGNIFVGGKFAMQMARVSENPNNNLSQIATLTDAYFGFNTIVGLKRDITQYVLHGKTHSDKARQHKNTIFENNIVYCAPDSNVQMTQFPSGVKGRNNIVYKQGGTGPLPAWLTDGGVITSDPKLRNPQATITDNAGRNNPDAGNNFNVNNYLIDDGSSPAINRAVTTYPFNNHFGVEEARIKDYFGATKNNPDIGAHEYGGVVVSSLTASFTHSPSATTLVAGTSVSFVNTSVVTGTANITGTTWKVRKGTSLVSTVTTNNLTYVFATEGSYTVELTVTATGGLTDVHTVSFTINPPQSGVVVTAAFSASPSQTTLNEGTSVAFTDQSTVQNSTKASVAWAVLSKPGLAVIATGAGATFNYLFNTPGEFRVRQTVTAASGDSGQETRDYVINEVADVSVDASFTSSDVDGLIDEGDSVTFGDTSDVTGTTIIEKRWIVERLGGGQVEYEGDEITHTFAQAGIYTVTLQISTAAGLSDSASMNITVRTGITVGHDWLVVSKTIAAPTSAGSFPITTAALGTKVPKGMHIRMVGATALNTAASGALLSEGAASSQHQWVHTRFSADNEAASKAWRYYNTDAVAVSLDSAGAKTGEAKFVTFIEGGMELDVTDAFPAGYLIEVTFYAGDKCQFWAGTQVVGNTDQANPVQTGIDQDAVYLCSCWASARGIAQQNADMSRGWAVKTGAQFHFRNLDRHGEANSYLLTRLQPRAASSAEGTGGFSSVEARDFSPNGFALEPHSSSLLREISMFAFYSEGYTVDLADIALPTSGTLTHELPFEAQAVQALTSSTTQGGQFGAGNAVGQGWYSGSIHGPTHVSGSIASANGAATTDTWSMLAEGFRVVNGSGADFWDGSGSIDIDSWNVSPWTDQPALEYRVIVLAIQKGTEVIDTAEEPVADFLIMTRVDEESGWVTVELDGSISNGNGETISEYAWDFGDGTTSSAIAPVKVYKIPGVYTISLTVTTVAGSNTKTVDVQVITLDTPDQLILVGDSPAEDSGGHTPSGYNEETMGHTHNIANLFMLLRDMTEDEYNEFMAMESNPEFAMIGLHAGVVIFRMPDGETRFLHLETS